MAKSKVLTVTVDGNLADVKRCSIHEDRLKRISLSCDGSTVQEDRVMARWCKSVHINMHPLPDNIDVMGVIEEKHGFTSHEDDVIARWILKAYDYLSKAT